MNRRNMLLGLGAALAGTSATIGTGAFSAAQLRNRQADISVVNDTQGLIGLVPNEDISGIELSGGELTIALGENGINVNSIYQFGYFAQNRPIKLESSDSIEDSTDEGTFPFVTDDPTSTVEGNFKSAFLVRNQTDSPTDVSMDFEVDKSASEPGDTVFLFETHYVDDEGDLDTDVVRYEGYSSEMSMSVQALGPGEDFGVSFLVDSTDGEVGDAFTASLSITAGEAVEE